MTINNNPNRETPDNTTIIAGETGSPFKEADDGKLVMRTGGVEDDTNFSIDGHDLGSGGDGDKVLSADDIGGASLIVASLESSNGAFSVKVAVEDKDGNQLRERTPPIFDSQEIIDARTVPVAADNLTITITDESGNSSNVVDGSVNIHSGGPSAVLNLDEQGAAITPRQEDADHRTGSSVDINASDEVLNLDVPTKPDAVRVLVTGADGDFDVTIDFTNTQVSFDGGSSSNVDTERAVMSNSDCKVTISDTSGSSNTVNYDVIVV